MFGLRLVKTPRTDRQENTSRKSIGARVAAAILFAVWLSGCVPAFISKRISADQPGSDRKQELIKPSIADSAGDSDTIATSASTADTVKTGNDTKISGMENPGEHSKDLLDRSGAVAQTNNGRERARVEDPKDQELKATAMSEKGDARNVSTEKVGNLEKSSTSDSAGEEATDTIIKHHDHTKYVNEIRNKAIDQLNREKDVDFARLCRNTTTDLWSLTLYRRSQKTYYFVDYSWNEVNLKWEKVFSSPAKPLSGWKQHLDFSAAGKECRLLKGSEEK